MLRYKHLSKLVVLLNFVAHKTSSRLAYFVSIKFVQTTTVLICRANWASAAMALVHLHSDMEDAGVWSPDNVRLSFLHGNPMLKYVTFAVFGQIHLDIYLDSITLQKEKIDIHITIQMNCAFVTRLLTLSWKALSAWWAQQGN
jgi:hypothetical protein